LFGLQITHQKIFFQSYSHRINGDNMDFGEATTYQ